MGNVNISVSRLGKNVGVSVSKSNGFGTAVLKNTEDTELSTTEIHSGATEDIIAPDGTAKLLDSEGGYLADIPIQSGKVVDVYTYDAVARLVNSEGTILSNTSILAAKTGIIIAPDATAVVKDTEGNILATEDIPSSVTKDIVINVGYNVLRTYPYDAFNTGANTTFAVGDDKWVRDNIANPEIAKWDTGLVWSTPKLNPNDPTKIKAGTGSNPDGSGTNIFGNLERYTDELGGQDFSSGYKIDHFTGLAWDQNVSSVSTWLEALSLALASSFNGKNDWFIPNAQQFSLSKQWGVNLDFLGQEDTTANRYFSSTRTQRTGGSRYIWARMAEQYFIDRDVIDSATFIACRLAFTYNPTTKQMDLI